MIFWVFWGAPNLWRLQKRPLINAALDKTQRLLLIRWTKQQNVSQRETWWGTFCQKGSSDFCKNCTQFDNLVNRFFPFQDFGEGLIIQISKHVCKWPSAGTVQQPIKVQCESQFKARKNVTESSDRFESTEDGWGKLWGDI